MGWWVSPSCAFVLCVPLALGACGGSWIYQPPSCSGEVADPSTATPRRLHVRLLLTRQGREQRHEVIVDSEPGRVLAIGLTPMGTVAYRVIHDAEGVQVRNGLGRFLGLDPELAYDAIVRSLAVGVAAPSARVDGDALSLTRDECRYRARLVVISDRPTPPPGAPAPP